MRQDRAQARVTLEFLVGEKSASEVQLRDAEQKLASFMAIQQDVKNDYFTSHPILDLDSLKNRSLPQDFLVLNYSGVLGSNVSVEGQYSQRHLTFEHDGSLFTDLVKGTVLIDESTGGYYNTPYFCGVCTNEKRSPRRHWSFAKTPCVRTSLPVLCCVIGKKMR